MCRGGFRPTFPFTLSDTEPNSTSAHGRPWATLAAFAIALGAFLSPAALRLLEYDRILAQDGQWWRLFTGNFVHYSRSELFWNAAVLLVAGAWAERVMAMRARVLYVIAPTMIGLALFLFEPHLGRYAGLSGVCAALVAFLALAQLRLSQADRWFWRTVLALLVLKIAAEAVLASRWFAHYPDPTVRSVPLVHLTGVVAAMVALGARRRSRHP